MTPTAALAAYKRALGPFETVVIRRFSFFWNARSDASTQWNSHYAGKKAGSLNRDGYVCIGIRNKRFAAHRLAWFWMTGSWPSDQIDHVDGNRQFNAFDNLRQASQQQNNRNIRCASNNKTGIKGVCFDSKTGKYQAQIRVGGGRRKYLGQFTDLSGAADAYRDAALKFHGEFARI
jgi:hypothetical protein